VDSINRNYRILNDPSFYLYDEYRDRYEDISADETYTGEIKIIVDVENLEIVIKDNGIGIKRSDLESCLLPEHTDKEIGSEYGFKGYGLTFAAFISNYISIKSKYFADDSFGTNKIELEGLLDWLVDSSGDTDFPAEPVPDATEADTQLEEYNTSIKLQLSDNYSSFIPAISSADQAFDLVDNTARSPENNPLGFEYILRSRTAIGNVRQLFNNAPIVPIDIHVSVEYSDGSSVNNYPITYSYYHPKDHEHVKSMSYSFEEYYENYKTSSFERDFRCLFRTVENEIVGTRTEINCNYAISSISTTRLGNIEDQLGLSNIDTGDAGIRYGVHLAIDGMPVGIQIDDWDRGGGYRKRYFVVVNAELNISDQLDPGRKGISDYFAALISDRALDLIGSETVDDSDPFGSYARKHLDHGRREDQGADPEEFQEMLTKVEEEADNQSAEDIERVNTLSSLRFCPTDEQEVIALFYQLVSSNIIKGYETIYQAGSRAVYDSGMEYAIDISEENRFDNDPVGIGQLLVEQMNDRGLDKYIHRDHFAGKTILPQLCVEFKKNVGGFLQEVNDYYGRSKKSASVIDILVAWDDTIPPTVNDTSYTLDSISGAKRRYHGTTHYLGITGDQFTTVHCILLKDVLGAHFESQE